MVPAPPDTHLCTCQLAPASDSLVPSVSTSQVTEHPWCLKCHSVFFSSFAAMDGVPFMISEKFSCVPESVSFMHDCPSLPPPPA